MKIMIVGASGMIGQALVTELEKSAELTVVGRSKPKLQGLFPAHRVLRWEELATTGIKNIDVIINLSGENIGVKRWTKKQKQEILASRVRATSHIAKLCAQLGEAAPRLLNASAIGIYGLQKTTFLQNKVIYDETMLPETSVDFIAQVGSAWEQALDPAVKAVVSICKLRFAVVLSKQGGALRKMLPSFKCGLGAVLGSGKQPFPWVALEDVVRAICFIIEKPEIQGAVNIVAPEVVSQRQFAQILAKSLTRPLLLKMPAFVVRMLFGEMANELLLNGQKVCGKKLIDRGFAYQYNELEPALKNIL